MKNKRKKLRNDIDPKSPKAIKGIVSQRNMRRSNVKKPRRICPKNAFLSCLVVKSKKLVVACCFAIVEASACSVQ
jgi:hypothetical protein